MFPMGYEEVPKIRQPLSQKYNLKTYRRFVEDSSCLLQGVGGKGIRRISLLSGQEQEAVRKQSHPFLSEVVGLVSRCM